MKTRLFLSLLVVLTLVLTLVGAASAQGPSKFTVSQEGITLVNVDQVTLNKEGPAPQKATNSNVTSVIVKLDVDSLAAYRGDKPGMAPTSPGVTGKNLDLKSPAAQTYLGYVDQRINDFMRDVKSRIPQAQLTYRYNYVFGGVALRLPPSALKDLSKVAGVKAVYPDVLQHVDTDNSPQFIGAPTIWAKLGGRESSGEHVIVGVIDTGIWPEHPSFADPDPSGKAYEAPYPAPVGDRQCNFTDGPNGEQTFNCNNKLIAAYEFLDTYKALQGGLTAGEFDSARDAEGHGTHTSSTSAGNAGVAASIFGVSRGTVSGIAPRAQLIMYKALSTGGGYSSDLAAAAQQSILDGVNVINYSISGGANPYSDLVEMAFLDAYDMGIFVSASAGNSGPAPETTDHRSPWVTTVAASTENRSFLTTVTVTSDVTDTLTFSGVSVSAPLTTPADVVLPPAGQELCGSVAGGPNPFTPGQFAGQVVICMRGVSGRVEKGNNVFQAGAVGMILYNASDAQDLDTDNHFLPAVHTSNTNGLKLIDFLNSHTNVEASWPSGVASPDKGDVMAAFSSRGGPAQTLGVSKPDITAPGVQILAGASPQHNDASYGPQGELFQAIQGTSMSSPHIAGSAALLKALHPLWTPGQIKSALMTTASQKVVKEDGTTAFTPFDAGSGRVDLTKAGDPGLTFDVSSEDYVTYQDQLYRANYPSVYIPAMPGLVTVSRTATSVLAASSTWTTIVNAPTDLKVTVPASFTVAAGGTFTFNITVDARDVPVGQTRTAKIALVSGTGTSQRLLRIPVTIVRGQPALTLTKSCNPANVVMGKLTQCKMTVTNTSFSSAWYSLKDAVPANLQVVPASITGGLALNGTVLSRTGTIPAANPPNISLASGMTPAGGYLELTDYGVTPISGVGDDAVLNYSLTHPVKYGGESYSKVGFGSNGYVILGGSSGGSDVTITGQQFPNSARPNNVIAPFWTDLNPPAATTGGLYLASFTDSGERWYIFEWKNVPEFSSGKLVSTQIWIGAADDATPVDDVSVAYNLVEGDGDNHLLSVGAENKFGNTGGNLYYNGSGTLPTPTTQFAVVGAPGYAPSRTFAYMAKGVRLGKWDNYALLTSPQFFGTEISKFSGQVVAAPAKK